GNMGCVPPQPGFLQALRDACDRSGALLIFDEVITGFRLGYTGAQGYFGVMPDLTCLGKVIGGGLPLAAYGGRACWMSHVAPAGPVYQAGTLSGNPLAVRAGLAVLAALAAGGVYERLEHYTARLAAGLSDELTAAGVPHVIERVGSMLTVFFGTTGPVRSLDDARRADPALYARFFHGLLARGVYLPPSQFECWFVSTAHGEAELDRTLTAVRETLRTW
ncbi:MAG TPA: aminotransferase class III-fold pyridoxal phosphate-dependent enzyme, partial [Bacillota bacterium]